MALMGVTKTLPEVFTSYQKEIETELRGIVANKPLPLYSMLRYHLGWEDEQSHPCHGKSGKLIRSTLCLLSCQAVEGNVQQILPAAAALELIHNFTLIHDDIEDTSLERHHRLTVWKLWGQAQAINAGDAMFALSYLALLKLKEGGVEEGRIVHVTKFLSKTCIQLCEGQVLDIAYERRRDITTKDYFAMIMKKTAALIAASTFLGAYLSTKDGKIVDCLFHFGKELGLAFQIRDDILGIWGAEEKTGKSVKDDVSRGKKTLPLVYGLENSRGKDKEELEEIYRQEFIGGEDITRVVKILERLGARSYAQGLAEQHYHRALAQLEATGLDPLKQAPLREAARFLVERDY